MSELTEFLLARIAEDESAARAAIGGTPYFPYRHDPARVLAECAAKRRIVEVHHPLDNDPEPFCWNCDEEAWPCKTMAALASVYADHEDFRQEWL